MCRISAAIVFGAEVCRKDVLSITPFELIEGTNHSPQCGGVRRQFVVTRPTIQVGSEARIAVLPIRDVNCLERVITFVAPQLVNTRGVPLALGVRQVESVQDVVA